MTTFFDMPGLDSLGIHALYMEIPPAVPITFCVNDSYD